MARGTPLRTHQLREICVAAGCDERTVARAILGMPVQPMTLQRIERALHRLGYPRPAAADIGDDDGGGGDEAA